MDYKRKFSLFFMVIQQKFYNFKRKLSGIEDRIRIARLIGEFYFDECRERNLKLRHIKACECVSMLGITRIEYSGRVVTITLIRPGLIIGRKGLNINNLTSFLCRGLGKYISIKVVEEKVLSHLYPFYVDIDCSDDVLCDIEEN